MWQEYKHRKLIHNKLLEIQGNIRVVCRVRPVLEVERRMNADVDVTDIPNEDTIIINRDALTRNRYEFDRVFAPDASQESVFESVQPLCISVLDGYNVCIFACKLMPCLHCFVYSLFVDILMHPKFMLFVCIHICVHSRRSDWLWENIHNGRLRR